ncbi:uncharacterized protein LOC128679392 [Plodia interpunctella]|uniref:uncharacterized protein LOC128679392 n=1 Tax=Plodia interpunctella TaxID=58824 RepID=UPI00236818A2|nr:uncharacterized protein LOC128679392 [Plodia interpunctella]
MIVSLEKTKYALISLKKLKTEHYIKMIVLLLSMLINQSVAVTVRREEPVDTTKSFDNWTTCEEFLDGAIFDEKRLLDVDWKVFYFWAEEYDETYIVRFRPPTEMEINRFKEEIDKRVHKASRPTNVNWNNTAFFVESTVDLSAFFIRTETSGKFRVISSLIFEHLLQPEVIFAMKIVEPGYLAFMNCEFKVGAALAPVEIMPKDDQLIAAASLFKMRNPLGFPYRVQNNVPDISVTVDPNDIMEDEEETEVQMHGALSLD